MAEHLGCQTFVVTPDSAGVADEPCGHLAGQHKASLRPGRARGGRCLVGGCGCPTYTPPGGPQARPVAGRMTLRDWVRYQLHPADHAVDCRYRRACARIGWT